MVSYYSGQESFLVQYMAGLVDYESITVLVLTPDLWYGSCFYIRWPGASHDAIESSPELNKAFSFYLSLWLLSTVVIIILSSLLNMSPKKECVAS